MTLSNSFIGTLAWSGLLSIQHTVTKEMAVAWACHHLKLVNKIDHVMVLRTAIA